MPSATPSYDAAREALHAGDGSGATVEEARVEVNQRALIDKILARYASANAVYRELLQNSNDAEATVAEIHLSTNGSTTSNGPALVTQVVYQNNGQPFRKQDWSRLRKIAEGNPDVNKIGAFGVGAYTMFSICEEPLVMSGGTTLAFVWKGDALWTRQQQQTALTKEIDGKNDKQQRPWTAFVLPSRDPYPLPDLVEFGQFLCVGLTFTGCLRTLHVHVDDVRRLTIRKTQLQEPTVVKPPPEVQASASSWWSRIKNDGSGGASTTSTGGVFALGKAGDGSITETVVQMTAEVDGESSTVRARYVSAKAKTNIGPDMAKKMERVTKKKPPKEVTVQAFINASATAAEAANSGGTSNRPSSARAQAMARAIASAFAPPLDGGGRVFIGFRTSQTTGLAAHLAAPLLPTVEREAVDFQDPTLRLYNTELLEISGIVLRLALEHSMALVGVAWDRNENERRKAEETIKKQLAARGNEAKSGDFDRGAKGGGENQVDDDTGGVASGSMFGFAKFMANGVKKKIVNVIKTVEDIAMGSDEDGELFNPPDPRPLCNDEHDAIMLMQSFCPRQSTPDPRVGTALAEGFARCLPHLSPPVLSGTGVVRGSAARLSNRGMEAFVPTNVVRSVVYRNAAEYHDVVAGCKALTVDDIVASLQGRVLQQEELIRFIRWWVKYSRIEPSIVTTHGPTIKENVVFVPCGDVEKDYCSSSKESNKSDDTTSTMRGNNVKQLRAILHYLDKGSFPACSTLPMPDSVMPRSMQNVVGGQRLLSDLSLRAWFTPLPIETWASFISQHSCLTNGKAEDAEIRLSALHTLSQAYGKKNQLGPYLKDLLTDKKCIPCDAPSSRADSSCVTDFPGDLYLNSAELAAFDEEKQVRKDKSSFFFKKASASLAGAGVTDDFLVCLGVRKTVSIDFLFTQLDTLKWSDNPKPLIAYLRSSARHLSDADWSQLRNTQYLPAERDKSRTYAPSELYLPRTELRLFSSFIPILQWPSGEDIASERSAHGSFLRKLGCKVDPPLQDVLHFVVNDVTEDVARMRCLNFISLRLGPGGAYEKEYARSRASIMSMKFLPCIRKEIFPDSLDTVEDRPLRELQAPNSCYSHPSCLPMGVPVLDPELQRKTGRSLGSSFQCEAHPPPSLLVRRLLEAVSRCESKMATMNDMSTRRAYCGHVARSFDNMFRYLSTQTNEFDKVSLETLKNSKFIPCGGDKSITFFKPEDVYFADQSSSSVSPLTERLFHVVKFSPFLAAVGVKSEASVQDIFRIMIASPEVVLKKVGSEANYRTLLRRIAANPPFQKVTKDIRESPFLLAYKVEEDEGAGSSRRTQKYLLARAEDIYIIDNSFFARMFPVLRAPHESDLEEFYSMIGSPYISKSVNKRFEVSQKQERGTPLTVEFEERLRERAPLLVCPSITSRPLKPNAGAVLKPSNLDIVEAVNVRATYSLGPSAAKNHMVTCCAKSRDRTKTSLYITQNYDWFDVGNAIGGLILTQCQLEDAFFVGSLLEAPLEQLRARGFPVDRVLQPSEPGISEPPRSATQNVDDSKLGDQKLAESVQQEDYHSVLTHMFPDCDEAYIRKQLGSKPSTDKVTEVANSLAAGNYPKKKGAAGATAKDTQTPSGPSGPPPQPTKACPLPPSATDKKAAKEKGTSSAADYKRKLAKVPGASKVLGRMLTGGSSGGGVQPTTTTMKAPSQDLPSFTPKNDGRPVPSDADATGQKRLEDLLQQKVRSCRGVDSAGVNSPDTLLTSIPEGLERGSDGCEVIPGQQLKPFNGRARHGIKVFSSQKHASSDCFVRDNFDAVHAFADVLHCLCQVYSVNVSSVAIYHEPSGGTIAFNSGGALHFNLRFFCALHYAAGGGGGGQPSVDSACYSYWFTVMSHELAHNLVVPHNKDHEFYTESYVQMFLPKLASMLAQRGLV